MLLARNLLIFFGIFIIGTIFLSSASAQEAIIPDWIKNNASWWADGLIDDGSFVSGMQWLISNGIIILEPIVEAEQLDFEPGEGLELNCSIEIDKDGDGVPDNLDVVGSIDWSNCNLMRLNLSNFELSGANLSGANLYETNLSGANLSGANLSGADLSGVIGSAIYNSGTILNCIGHPICLND